MSIFRSGLFFVSISLLTLASCSNAKKVIVETATVRSFELTGRVLDQDSKTPISNAEVWVSGTTIYDKTDKDGRYDLRIPQGYYELAAKANGYKSVYRKVDFESATTHDFSLTPKRAMGSFDISGNIGHSPEQIKREAKSKKKPRKPIDNFIDYFINDDLNCELLNPQDVRFSQGEDEGVMRVNGPVQLQVMNYELGYKITIDLKDFVTKQYSGILGLNKKAHFFFEELSPKTEKQANEWEKNRLHYFQGSLRHFLIAMASDKSPLYFGYRMYSGQFVSSTSAMAYSSSSVSDIEVEKYDIFYPELNGNTVLKLDGELRVEYVNKGVNDPNGIMGLDLYPYQTSWLSLSIPSIEFSKNGTFRSPQYVEEKGVWRYTPVCKMVPENYLPKLKK
jgi:hypothetical protein